MFALDLAALTGLEGAGEDLLEDGGIVERVGRSGVTYSSLLIVSWDLFGDGDLGALGRLVVMGCGALDDPATGVLIRAAVLGLPELAGCGAVDGTGL